MERLGRYHATLTPGLHFLIPVIDQVSYVHSLKEDAITIASQTAVTRDNVVLSIDGVLYMRIVDPVKASYGVSDAHYALTQLAQTTMRSEASSDFGTRVLADTSPLLSTFTARKADAG